MALVTEAQRAGRGRAHEVCAEPASRPRPTGDTLRTSAMAESSVFVAGGTGYLRRARAPPARGRGRLRVVVARRPPAPPPAAARRGGGPAPRVWRRGPTPAPGAGPPRAQGGSP